jgi:hypothetical protein
MKELIINIYMLIKSIIKPVSGRLIVVILRLIKKQTSFICGLQAICYVYLSDFRYKKFDVVISQKK